MAKKREIGKTIPVKDVPPDRRTLKRSQGSERIGVTLPPEDAARLNKYCVEIANRNGKIPHALKQKIGRMAFKEWLDKHEKDLTINFEEW